MTGRTPGPNDWTINDDGHLVQSDGSCFNLDDAANILTDYDATLDILRADNARLREALERAVQDLDSGWAEDADAHFPWLPDARAALAGGEK